MRAKIGLFLGIAFFLVLISAHSVFSQNEAAQEEPASQEELIAPEQLIQENPSESETQWLWGEVASVDLAAKQIVIKYLDYDTDAEKEISISVDDKTTYENVQSIDEIKPLDALSIDYAAALDGKNIAKNISVEKPEVLETPQEESQQAPQEEELNREGQP